MVAVIFSIPVSAWSRRWRMRSSVEVTRTLDMSSLLWMIAGSLESATNKVICSRTRKGFLAVWKPSQIMWVMMTSSNGTFSASLVLCERNPPVIGGFPPQRPVTLSFDVFFDLRLNKRLSKRSRRCWFEAPSRRHWNYHCKSSSAACMIRTRIPYIWTLLCLQMSWRRMVLCYRQTQC